METKGWGYGYGDYRNFLQYFDYIGAVSFIGGGNHQPAASSWQTVSHNVETPELSEMCYIGKEWKGIQILGLSTCIIQACLWYTCTCINNTN